MLALVQLSLFDGRVLVEDPCTKKISEEPSQPLPSPPERIYQSPDDPLMGLVEEARGAIKRGEEITRVQTILDCSDSLLTQRLASSPTSEAECMMHTELDHLDGDDACPRGAPGISLRIQAYHSGSPSPPCPHFGLGQPCLKSIPRPPLPTSDTPRAIHKTTSPSLDFSYHLPFHPLSSFLSLIN